MHFPLGLMEILSDRAFQFKTAHMQFNYTFVESLLVESSWENHNPANRSRQRNPPLCGNLFHEPLKYLN